MKITFKMLAVLSMIYFTGCKEELNSLTITKNSSTAEFTIASGTNGAVQEITQLNLDLNQIAADNGVDASKFQSLKLKSAAVTSSNGKNYDAFESVSVSIEAAGLPKKVVVVKNPVNGNGAASIALDVDPSLDLLPYFQSTDIKIYFEGNTSTAVADDIVSKLDLAYNIEVKLID